MTVVKMVDAIEGPLISAEASLNVVERLVDPLTEPGVLVQKDDLRAITWALFRLRSDLQAVDKLYYELRESTPEPAEAPATSQSDQPRTD